MTAPSAAAINYWQSVFKSIKFERVEKTRTDNIRACFHAAGRLNGLQFTVRDDHPYLGEIRRIFGSQHVRVETGYALPASPVPAQKAPAHNAV